MEKNGFRKKRAISMHGGFEPVVPLVPPRPPPNDIGEPAPDSSVVELRFRCTKLRPPSMFSSSDPFIVVYADEGTNQWREIGRTETVANTMNPTFATAIAIDYFFAEVQHLRVEVFDRDGQSEKLSAHDYLGCVEFTMAQLMSAIGQCLELKLGNTSGIQSFVIIDAEERQTCADHEVTVQFSATNLDRKNGIFRKSDPFLNIYRLKEDNVDPRDKSSWVLVWRSPHIPNTLNPVWPRVTLSMRALCNGDQSRMLSFECLDWESNGYHQWIGSCMMTAREFVSRATSTWDLVNEERRRKKGTKYVNSGELHVLSLQSVRLDTFADYLRGGCELNLIVGIDFSSACGASSNPASLHYRDASHPGKLNDYEMAIEATSTILEAYDHDKKFPVYGFGAVSKGSRNNCFPLTGDPSQPEIHGAQGILNAYKEALQSIHHAGQTFFAPLIEHAMSIIAMFSKNAMLNMQNRKYYVLLIITDGVISDMADTIDAIVTASYLPLSIVIVGVGNGNFKNMETLDGDGKLMRSRNGRVADRDIVQFVPYRDFANSQTRLAKETLAEIPMQLTQHFRSKGMGPNPSPKGSAA